MAKARAVSGTESLPDNPTMPISPGAVRYSRPAWKSQKWLDEVGAGAKVDDAKTAMRKNALGQGPGGTDGAVDAQGRAVEALRDMARKSSPAGGRSRGSGAGEDSRRGPRRSSARKGQFGDARGTDPLGRQMESLRGFDPVRAVFRRGAGKAQRREELRRRLGEPARPRDNWTIWNVYYAAIEPVQGSLEFEVRSSDGKRQK